MVDRYPKNFWDKNKTNQDGVSSENDEGASFLGPSSAQNPINTLEREQRSTSIDQNAPANAQREPVGVFPSDFGAYLLHPEHKINQSSEIKNHTDDMTTRQKAPLHVDNLFGSKATDANQSLTHTTANTVNNTNTTAPPDYTVDSTLTHDKDINFFGDSNTVEPRAFSRSTLDQDGLQRGSISTLPSAGSARRNSAQQHDALDSSINGTSHSEHSKDQSANSAPEFTDTTFNKDASQQDASEFRYGAQRPVTSATKKTISEQTRIAAEHQPAPRRSSGLLDMASAAVATVGAVGAAGAAAILGKSYTNNKTPQLPSAYNKTTPSALSEHSSNNFCLPQKDSPKISSYVNPTGDHGNLASNDTSQEPAHDPCQEPAIHGQCACFHTQDTVCNEIDKSDSHSFCDRVKEPEICGQDPSFFGDSTGDNQQNVDDDNPNISHSSHVVQDAKNREIGSAHQNSTLAGALGIATLGSSTLAASDSHPENNAGTSDLDKVETYSHPNVCPQFSPDSTKNASANNGSTSANYDTSKQAKTGTAAVVGAAALGGAALGGAAFGGADAFSNSTAMGNNGVNTASVVSNSTTQTSQSGDYNTSNNSNKTSALDTSAGPACGSGLLKNKNGPTPLDIQDQTPGGVAKTHTLLSKPEVLSEGFTGANAKHPGAPIGSNVVGQNLHKSTAQPNKNAGVIPAKHLGAGPACGAGAIANIDAPAPADIQDNSVGGVAKTHTLLSNPGVLAEGFNCVNAKHPGAAIGSRLADRNLDEIAAPAPADIQDNSVGGVAKTHTLLSNPGVLAEGFNGANAKHPGAAIGSNVADKNSNEIPVTQNSVPLGSNINDRDMKNNNLSSNGFGKSNTGSLDSNVSSTPGYHEPTSTPNNNNKRDFKTNSGASNNSDSIAPSDKEIRSGVSSKAKNDYSIDDENMSSPPFNLDNKKALDSEPIVAPANAYSSHNMTQKVVPVAGAVVGAATGAAIGNAHNNKTNLNDINTPNTDEIDQNSSQLKPTRPKNNAEVIKSTESFSSTRATTGQIVPNSVPNFDRRNIDQNGNLKSPNNYINSNDNNAKSSGQANKTPDERKNSLPAAVTGAVGSVIGSLRRLSGGNKKEASNIGKQDSRRLSEAELFKNETLKESRPSGDYTKPSDLYDPQTTASANATLDRDSAVAFGVATGATTGGVLGTGTYDSNYALKKDHDISAPSGLQAANKESSQQPVSDISNNQNSDNIGNVAYSQPSTNQDSNTTNTAGGLSIGRDVGSTGLGAGTGAIAGAAATSNLKNSPSVDANQSSAKVTTANPSTEPNTNTTATTTTSDQPVLSANSRNAMDEPNRTSTTSTDAIPPTSIHPKYACVPGAVHPIKPAGTVDVDSNGDVNFIKLNEEASKKFIPAEETGANGQTELRRGSIKRALGKFFRVGKLKNRDANAIQQNQQ